MGPGDLARLVAPLTALAGGAHPILVGADTADDAGVYQLGAYALVATADFITPVCDDPGRFGRVAAANSLSDVYAMGGRPLFALNLCCFPEDGVPDGVFAAILAGAADALAEAGCALLGGHTVRDPELKYGLAVIGEADPARLLTNAEARAGQRLLLTKPLGTGVLINAYKQRKLDSAGFEPALTEMERLNADACRLALAHGATAATDVTGFGLVGHALAMARASQVGVQVVHDRLPVHDAFYRLSAEGVTTGSTCANRGHAGEQFVDRAGLDEARRQIAFDPQTSGGLLLAVANDAAPSLLAALLACGHRAADIGEVIAGPPRFELR